MFDKGYFNNKKFVKCAQPVGDAMGRFHPSSADYAGGDNEQQRSMAKDFSLLQTRPSSIQKAEKLHTTFTNAGEGLQQTINTLNYSQ